ncbi:MAG: hypothetical protein GEV10_29800 [Streptosporangiales bacterium]|nr:hypothetical protein [Streptosporangiales bacterium]
MGQSARLAAHWYATALVLVASAALRLLTPPRWYPIWWAVAEVGLGVVVCALAWWVSRGARPARPAALATGGVIVAGAVVLAVLDVGYEFAAVPAVVGLLATATSPEAFTRTTGAPATSGEAWAVPAFVPGPRPGVTSGLPVPPWQPGSPAPASPARPWGPPAQQWPPSPHQQARQPAPWPGGPQGQDPSSAGQQQQPPHPSGVRSAQDRMATEYGPAGRSVPALGDDAPVPDGRQAGTPTPTPEPAPYADGGAQAGEQALRARRHRVPAPQEPESGEPESVVPEPVLPEEALPRPTWDFDPRPRGRRAAPPPDDSPDSGERGVEWAPRRRRHATPESDDTHHADEGRATEEE